MGTKERRSERTDRVLVAVMNSHRDFEIAREQGWYRIPYERAPSRVGADYLAFYQTSVFEEDRWAVNYYATVGRYHVVSRRRLLPDEPDHPRANDLYYRIDIGPLLRLSPPIPSQRLRRISFIPTTLERLLHAEEINDLWCGSPDEERLWRAFKESGIGVERRYPLREDAPEYTVDFALLCKQGRVGVCIEGAPPVRNVRMVREFPLIDEYSAHALGWTIVQLGHRELAGPLATCVKSIMKVVEQLGGVAFTGSTRDDARSRAMRNANACG
ncbi:MAG TPA: hypothetical protein VMW58_04270 [Anaerolineae bacterium]|nr:hypothetical protein [Anaerolineae bacterium]